MESVTRKVTQSPPAVIIDGVPHRQCGEGRKQRRAGAIECGEIKPVDQFVVNTGYSDGHGLICQACGDKQNARYAERVATALVPTKTYDDVPIGGDGVCRGVSVLVDGIETPHLVVKEACRFWGLDSGGQMDRINSDAVLKAGLISAKLPTSQGAVPAYVLHYELVPLWLAGIETGKMRNRERATQLAAYQRVCGQVLADYFFGTKTAPPPPVQRVTTDGSMAVYDDTRVLRYIDTALTQAVAPIYERLGMLDVLPRIDQTTQTTAATLSGVDQIIRKQIIRGQIYIVRVVGVHHLALAKRNCRDAIADNLHIIAIGRTGPEGDIHGLRLADYGGKFPFDPEDYERLAVIQTDEPEQGESLVLQHPLVGCTRLRLRNGQKSKTFITANEQGLRAYRALNSDYYPLRVLRALFGGGDQLDMFQRAS